MVGFRDFVTTTLAARAAYHCEEASGNLVDDGTISNNLTVNGTPVYEVPDSITYESGKAISFDGTTDFFAVINGLDPDTGGTGAQLCFFRLPAGDTGGIVYAMANVGGGTQMFIRINEDEITLSIQATTGNKYLAKLGSLAIDDDDWHLLVLVQPGGGVGIDLYLDSVLTPWTSEVLSGSGSLDFWFADVQAASDRYAVGSSADSGHVQKYFGDISCYAITRTIMSQAQVDDLWALTTTDPVLVGALANELQSTGNGSLPEGPGPDWWWRMNAGVGPAVLDIGVAQNRSSSPINADSIVTGGAPLFNVGGPLPDDPGNAAVYFDGVGDFFEIGVNGVSGQLVNSSTGSIGGFFSRNALVDENIIYGQSNDAGTAFWRLAINVQNIELIVQTSAGNRVTLTSQPTFSDNDFRFFTLTCDGSNYRLFLDGKEDFLFTIVTVGTGAEGDWFDAFAADNSSIASRADSGFTTETTGRVSELFIYDGEVLSSTTIAALFEAAIVDGILGSSAVAGLVVFENVTFRNGSLADIRVQNNQPTTFQQVIRGNRCKFLSGAQGDGVSYLPQCVLLEGPAQVQFRGCEADLQATPVFGRGGIVGTAVDETLVATQDGSIIVSDCDFDRMGFLDGTSFLSAVMCRAAFGMTVEDSRFVDCLGTAVGWLADAQRVSVIDNQIKGTTQALGAIHSGQGLNTRLGNAWLIRGNKAVDTVGAAINLNGVSSAGGTNFARNIAIQQNQLDNNLTGQAVRVNGVGDVLIEKNKADGCTFGVDLGDIAGAIQVLGNELDNASLAAIITNSTASLQLADLTVKGNFADGASVGDGILVTQVRRAYINDNGLIAMDEAVKIGEISVEGTFDGNTIISATTPFAFLAATTRVAFKIGINDIQSLGNANQITVSTATIEVAAHYHTITASGAIDLETINGPLVDGFTLILRRGLFSSDITIKDGTDNLNIGSDFLLDVDNDQIWLVRDGVNWNQLQRVEAL